MQDKEEQFRKRQKEKENAHHEGKSCKKGNHFAQLCTAERKKKTPLKKVNEIQEEEGLLEVYKSTGTLLLAAVTYKGEKEQGTMVDIKADRNKKVIQFKTGADVNHMPIQTYKKC